jgi:hypothetical protein
MDARRAVPQLPVKTLCQRFDSSFRGVVGGVAWRVGDALLAARDDDRCLLTRRCVLDDW